MIKEVFNLINSIHFETELLEAHDWDEALHQNTMQKLIEYFSICEKNDLDLVKADLGFIFDENISNVIFKYIDTVYEGLSELQLSTKEERSEN